MRLVEAISTDLMNQMMKVLASPKLTLVVYDEFEKIVSQCCIIFNTWEEEYDKVNSELLLACSYNCGNIYRERLPPPLERGLKMRNSPLIS